jgi:hypothetical protein
MEYEWDEYKRQINLQKHGLDFAIAYKVYESSEKLTLSSDYAGERREIDLAPVGNELLVLTMVYTYRGEKVRVISLRKASSKERKLYYETRNNY